MADIDEKRKRELNRQWKLGRLARFIISPLAYLFMRVMRYRVIDLKKVRKTVRNRVEEHDGPWLICPNHLTMIDSLIIAYALAPLTRYFLDYRTLPWNLPERANFERNPLVALLCYLAKCIPVSRGGDRSHTRDTLDACIYLLTKGERLLVFPEGGRSRTGRISGDSFSYGVGRFVTAVENCRVLSLYLRGEGQTSYGTVPRFGERFTVMIDTFRPSSPFNGLKGQRECARQIVERLQEMEERYFACRRQ